MAGSVYSWFWVPPLDGKPGLMMITDDHPGPHEAKVPFVVEDIANVLIKIESELPVTIGLFQLMIYCRGIDDLWFKISVHPETRQYKYEAAEISQGELMQLWDSREFQ